MGEKNEWEQLKKIKDRMWFREDVERMQRMQALKRAGLILLTLVLIVGLVTALDQPAKSAMESGGTSSLGSGSGRQTSSLFSEAGAVSPRPSATAAATPAATPAPTPWAQSADPLLVLVNEKVAVPKDWQTELIAINDSGDIKVDVRIYEDLMAMINAMQQENITVWVASGYRDEDLQQQILERSIQRRVDQGLSRDEAEAQALRTIQRPGRSEHHTGLAVDFNTVSDDFEATDAYIWLCAHAPEYGFLQRYSAEKAGITGIDNESWHFRYVGRENARKIADSGLCLEEYLGYHE